MLGESNLRNHSNGARQGRKTRLALAKRWQAAAIPKFPNLLQYVISGKYYARFKVYGKPVRVSLDTAN